SPITMTTVIVQKPQKSGWNSGICDCCQDMNSYKYVSCYGFWCFPCFTCTTTGDFGESTCLPLLDIFVCVPPVSLGMRVAVRHKYDIGGSICEDIMVTCCCIWCSWCQMSREIKAHKQTVTVVTTHPVIQPIPMATTSYHFTAVGWSDRCGTSCSCSPDGTNSVYHNIC
uniref:Plac8 onzin related protein 6 n=1 Tax=Sinocyclocheilus anshuiensis TaxID=1608454 RepID=A0A671M0H8_9TELE